MPHVATVTLFLALVLAMCESGGDSSQREEHRRYRWRHHRHQHGKVALDALSGEVGKMGVIRDVPEMPEGYVLQDTGIVDFNITEIDANPDTAENTSPQAKDVTIISSWVLFHVPGNRTQDLQSNVPYLVSGIRNAIADTIDVCRPSVGISKLHAVNFEPEPLQIWPSEVDDGMITTEEDDTSDVLLDVGHNLMRRHENQSKDTDNTQYVTSIDPQGKVDLSTNNTDSADDTDLLTSGAAVANDQLERLNVTQIKANYEIRVSDELGTNLDDVERDVDSLQAYTRFTDLFRALQHQLEDSGDPKMFQLDAVVLDDVGYARSEQTRRLPLAKEDTAVCAEEALLQHARGVHQCIMAACLVLVALITLAGSTVFTVKHVTMVPTRWNPLISPDSDSDRNW